MVGAMDDAGEALLASLLQREGFATGTLATPLRRPSSAAATAGPSQRRFWIQEQIEPGVNNLACVIELDTALDRVALERALAALAQRHEALRTCFVANSDDILEIIEPDIAAPIMVLQASTSEADPIAAFAAEPFALDRAPLWRTAILAAESGDQLLFCCHHAILDWTGIRNLTLEWQQLYDQARRGVAPHLATMPLQQADHAWLLRQPEAQARAEQDRDYWRERLSQPLPPLELMAANPALVARSAPLAAQSAPLAAQSAPLTAQPDCHSVPLHLDAALTSALRRFAASQGSTPFIVLLAAYATILGRFALAETVCIGTAIENRDHPGSAEIVGCLTDMLPLRCDLFGSADFAVLVKRLHAACSADFRHTTLGFADLVAAIAPERGTMRNPLYQTIFNLLPETPTTDTWPRLTPLQLPYARADLALELRDRGNHITGWLEYRAGRIPDDIAAALAAALPVLLGAGIAGVACAASQLPLLPPQNLPAMAPAPDAETLASLFTARVALQPEAVALLEGENGITYSALFDRAVAVAETLLRAGLQPEQPVAICLPRSIDQVVAMLAAMLAGGTMLSLDPDYPDALLAAILQDSAAPFMIAHAAPAWLPEAGGCHVLSPLAGLPTGMAMPAIATDAAAYVIYTSGSTGHPKGVIGLHRGMVNRLRWMWQAYPYGANETACIKTSPAFVDCISEIFGPLLAGVPALVVPGKAARDPVALTGLIRDHQISRMVLVPSLLRAWLETVPDLAQRLNSLRVCVSSGEALPIDLAHRFKALLPDCHLLNLYGSSEVSADVTWLEVSGTEQHRLPIGRALPGNRIIVADEAGRPLPPGAPGEIIVHGLAVARGYLGDAVLSAARFGHAPDGLAFFRTGDLAYALADGTLFYLGRRDRQVKISGVRVEPAEIEAVLMQHPQVRACHVAARRDGPSSTLGLVAYLAGSNLDITALRHFAGRHLARNLVPQAFVLLDELPLLGSGKINTAALPAPAPHDQIQAPCSFGLDPLEQLVATAWNSVLARPVQQPQDNFFDLGGSSLQAITAMARLSQALGRQLSVAQLFETPRLDDLARRLAANDGADIAAIPPRHDAAQAGQPAPASSNQAWLWDEYRIAPERIAYNLPLAYRISGPLDADALEAALQGIFRRHDILRSVLAEHSSGLIQIVQPVPERILARHDLSAQPDAEAALTALLNGFSTRPFALDRDLPLRAALIRLNAEEHCLVLVMHHVACDGWSGQILVQEIAQLYQRAALPAVDLHYADIARWQQQRGAQLAAMLPQYRTRLAGGETPRPAGMIRDGKAGGPVGIIPVRVDTARLNQLYALGQARQVTPFITMLATWACLLARFGQCEQPLLATPMAGRTQPGLQSIIGFFANPVLLRIDLGNNPDFHAALQAALDAVLAGLRHQDVPLMQIQASGAGWPQGDGGTALRCMFVMEDTIAWHLSLPGLRCALMQIPASPEARVDLALTVSRTDIGTELRLEFARQRVSESLAAGMAQALAALIEAVVATPHKSVDRLPLLTGNARPAKAAAPVEPPPPHGDIATCVAHWARQRPHAPAVSDGQHILSYAALNQQADAVAARLRNAGIKAEDRVGLVAMPSPRQLAGLLGIWRAGAIAVPLDPGYPAARLAAMLDDAGIAAILADAALERPQPQILLSEIMPGARPPASACGDAAAIIYTSGSTGRAKGVLIGHAALARLGAAKMRAYGLQAGDRLLQVVSPAFDVALSDLASTLTAGALLLTPPRQDVMPGRALLDTVRRHGITHMQIPAPLLAATPAPSAAMPLPDLRVVAVGGEVCPPETLQNWSRGRTLFIAYGPCESTVTVALARYQATTPAGSIGQPFCGAELSVRDPDGNVVPVGVAGELYIGGPNVALGYFAQPALTAERFLPDPTAGPEARCYRSGDAARMEPDGSFTFLGRLDRQIKLRGFRIEPGEIEAVLLAQPGIARALVNLHRDALGEKRLFAWVLPVPGNRPDGHRLRQTLSRQLPDHLVPAAVLPVAEIPLTPNGKTDWDRLPVAIPATPSVIAEAPGNTATESRRQLTLIWASLLARQDIGPDENFFEIGGHSLLVVRMQQQILDRLGLDLPVGEIFACPTLRSLAQRVDELRPAQTETTVEEFLL